jgi:hypothetical protein
MTNTFPKTKHRIENYTHYQVFRTLKLLNLPQTSQPNELLLSKYLRYVIVLLSKET